MSPKSSLVLVAPLRGWAASLETVPDAVFSARMLGDGLAIDPTGETLHAPCDGSIVTVAPQKHAVTLLASNGAEILMHVGVDTVGLGGAGLEAHVRPGQSVKAGDRLLSLDLNLLARRAKSVMTPIIVTNGERFSIAQRTQDRAVEVGEPLFELRSIEGKHPATTAVAGEETTREVVVALEHGIHARPAAMLASRLKDFNSDVTIEAHGKTANARSPVAMMSLGVRKGDRIAIRATGIDAAAATRALEATLRSDAPGHVNEIPQPAAPVVPEQRAAADGVLPGVVACRGLAAGVAVHLTRPEVEVTEQGAGVAQEESRLEQALEKVKAQLQKNLQNNRGTQREIVTAHLAFLEDPELLGATHVWISRGKSAGYAWRSSVREGIEALRASGDRRLAERADDLLDLELQVLLAIAGPSAQTRTAQLPENAILLAHDLLPSQLVGLDASGLAGICVATGGPTSHVAILAAALNVPTLVAMGPALMQVPAGAALVLDADAGLLRLTPNANQTAEAQERMASRRARRTAEREAAQRECRTADGERIEIFANVGSADEARDAVAQGAEGCGLLRTEFLFLDRATAPTLDEQRSTYQEIADAFSDRPLVLRTLDIGGDKPIAYIQLPAEENPALGLRGIRVSFQRPDLLRQQLSAILRVQGTARLHVLLPMITDAEEVVAVREIVEEIRSELGVDVPMPIGAMIETPAAAVNARAIAAVADFLSLGTNDLTQYTLAIDRGNPALAAKFNARHPAVLRLISATVEGARSQGKPVAVCGGLASDPAAVPILIGLGIRELSVVPAAIPQLKSLIGTLTLPECAALARAALER